MLYASDITALKSDEKFMALFPKLTERRREKMRAYAHRNDALRSMAAELLLYRRLLTGCTKKRATAYAVTANLCSAAAGWFLAFPLWRWAVSLL